MAIIHPPPEGTNGLQNPDMFNDRLHYKQASFVPFYNPTPLDMIYEKPYYGKIDTLGNAIYPSENQLEILPGPGLMMAQSFVVSAFNKLKSYMDEYISGAKNKLFADLFPGGYTPKSAWESLHSLYQAHYVNRVYDVCMNDFMATPSRARKIRNFKEYVVEYVNFTRVMNDQFPVTEVGFIMSTFCPNTITGLLIELEEIPHDNDLVKYENFISKPSWDKYLKVVSSFGFYVDKNCPWRIAANLDHPYMIQEMKSWKIEYKGNDLFDKYDIFYRAAQTSYEDFKVRLWNGYNYMLSDLELGDVVEYKVQNCKKAVWADIQSGIFKTILETSPKDPIPEWNDNDYYTHDGPFHAVYPDSFFLPFYLQARLIESKINYGEKKLHSIIKKILKINKYKGWSAAVDKIEEIAMQSDIYLHEKNKKYPRIKYFGNSISSGLHSYEQSDKVNYIPSSAEDMEAGDY